MLHLPTFWSLLELALVVVEFLASLASLLEELGSLLAFQKVCSLYHPASLQVSTTLSPFAFSPTWLPILRFFF
jgi:hypothetical protein